MTARGRAIWRAAALVVTLALAACGGDPTGLDPATAPQFAGGGGAGSGGPAAALDPALVGGWSRTLFFTDDRGFAFATETRWTFAADGGAERRVVTANLALGLADQVVTFGSWSTERGTLVVRLGPAARDTLRLSYRVEARLDGARLLLDDLEFVRVARLGP